ncbi:sulfite oxidase-like oxidoreductase [Mycolicibacter kumamotonensis]|uniref:Sulfite oxidase-like oxidoreductase n=1 Tax=Mycolicibacter kumamotonensis TaxID=354243 RepID=A0A1X0DSA5_9MYCO|nr:sulfite oxidase-like oxidoreductase [Mycolicibacter kumamotonensis]ORA75255.1 sulfite oxidase-like oxidoreductase [Mycolicibacter kumamotonensis]
MSVVNKGFHGRRTETVVELPPGQHLTTDFPVLQTGPTPHIDVERWRLTIRDEHGAVHKWTWAQFNELPSRPITVDIHCVTKWSKLNTRWRGVSLDTVLESVGTAAEFALVRCYGGYTTNIPVRDLRGERAWIVYEYDGMPLSAIHGGPARLLVPHLYFWKSAKWVRSIELRADDDPGFWESLGYHNYGDPWREQRYVGD